MTDLELWPAYLKKAQGEEERSELIIDKDYFFHVSGYVTKQYGGLLRSLHLAIELTFFS